MLHHLINSLRHLYNRLACPERIIIWGSLYNDLVKIIHEQRMAATNDGRFGKTCALFTYSSSSIYIFILLFFCFKLHSAFFFLYLSLPCRMSIFSSYQGRVNGNFRYAFLLRYFDLKEHDQRANNVSLVTKCGP